MMEKIGTLIIFASLALFSWVGLTQFEIATLGNVMRTFIAFSIIHFVFRFIIDEWLKEQIKDYKTRYGIGKVSAILYLVAIGVALTQIWIENPISLLVSYGILAALAGIALQDIFKNIVGGLVIFLSSTYRVGDRVQINHVYGDVIDIDVMYTTLLEIREWIDGDQMTGRLTTIPNAMALNGTIHNYTRDHTFIWDEIRVPVTYDSDWMLAEKKILAVAKKATEEHTKQADAQIKTLRQKYYLTERSTEPAVYVSMTDNWVELRLRFITPTRERRIFAHELTRKILMIIAEAPTINVASATSTISIHDLPEVHIKNTTRKKRKTSA